MDNRRLRAVQEAGTDIMYEKVEWDKLSRNKKKKFTTEYFGESIIEVEKEIKPNNN